MDTMDQGQAPVSEAPVKKGGGTGALIGIVIIIALLAAGGYYFWQSEQSKLGTDTAQTNGHDVTTENLKVVGTSDTTAAIESDLNATDIGSSESDLNGAEASF